MLLLLDDDDGGIDDDDKIATQQDLCSSSFPSSSPEGPSRSIFETNFLTTPLTTTSLGSASLPRTLASTFLASLGTDAKNPDEDDDDSLLLLRCSDRSPRDADDEPTVPSQFFSLEDPPFPLR